MKRIIKILILLLIVVIFAGTLVFLYQKSRKRPVVNKIRKPFTTDIIDKTVVTGTVIPRKEIEIKPQIIGIISEIYVEAGDIVKEGDLIAKIRVTPNMINLNNAETRFNQAEIALKDAKITFHRQKQLYENSFNDGDLILQKSNPAMLKMNAALFKFNKAKLDLADTERICKKQKQLLAKSIVSEDEYRKVELDLKKARENFKESQDNYHLVKEETREITEQEYQKSQLALNKAEEEFEAARNNLQLIKEGAIDDREKETNTLIRATTDGMVLDVAVKEGNLVIESSTSSIGTTVAVVADMNDMIFEGTIDESEVGKIREGMPLILKIGAIENEKFDASIEYVAPKGIKTAGAIQFKLRAKLKLKSPVFVRAGYSANADIVLARKNQVLAVKESWIQFKDAEAFVFVQNNPQDFVKKPITVGLSDGINIEVLSGITKDDQIRVP